METIKNTPKMTPILKQYTEIKKKYKDTILFFRLGDFYEMFYEDAITASKELQITLTSRNTGALTKIPMAGIPYHAAENYIARLIKKGYKVAICEQIEDPKLTKKLVKREVVQVITPGTVVDFNMLNQKSNNYLMAIYLNEKHIGISILDISTGEFLVTENSENEKPLNFLENELTRLSPAEILISEKIYNENKNIQKIFSYYPNLLINKYYDWVFEYTFAKNKLLDIYKVKSLQSFGLENKINLVPPAGAIIHYIQETQKQKIEHIDTIKIYSSSDFMELDNSTIRNLELVVNQIDNTTKRTLFSVLDHTQTPQGARFLRKNILQPLTNIEKIKQRLNFVDFFFINIDISRKIRDLLKKINDIERLASRISLYRANPRDLIALKNSLIHSIKIKKLAINENILNENIKNLLTKIPDVNDIIDLIEKSIIEEPSIAINNIIKNGFNSELDKYREAEQKGKQWIVELQQNEIKRTGINSLKIKYNKVFGYYIEITKPNLHLVPDDYIRKQTLTNAERFTFPKLQEYEELILSSTEKINELEEKLFKEIIEKIRTKIETLKCIYEQLC